MKNIGLKRVFAVALLFSVMAFAVGPVIKVSAEAVPEYKITYDSNDGNGVYQKTTKLMNVDIPVAEMTITHEGFAFVGWALDPLSSRADYSQGDYFSENKNTTLYAVWRKTGEEAESYVKSKRTMKVKNQTAICGKSFKLNATVEQCGKLVYHSSNSNILRLNSKGKGTPGGCGIVKITVTAPEDGLFAKTEKTVTVTVNPTTPKIKSLKSAGRGLVSCNWSKCKAVTGYQIKIVQSGRETKQKWKKTSFTASARSGVKYSIKVRAYKTSGKKTVYSSWSKVKKITVK